MIVTISFQWRQSLRLRELTSGLPRTTSSTRSNSTSTARACLSLSPSQPRSSSTAWRFSSTGSSSLATSWLTSSARSWRSEPRRLNRHSVAVFCFCDISFFHRLAFAFILITFQLTRHGSIMAPISQRECQRLENHLFGRRDILLLTPTCCGLSLYLPDAEND